MPKSDDQNSRSADTGQLADLRIAQVEAIPVAIPLTKPMIMGSERIVRATNVIVRLETEDGQIGWGEATSAPTMTGDLHAGMVAAITDYLAPTR